MSLFVEMVVRCDAKLDSRCEEQGPALVELRDGMDGVRFGEIELPRQWKKGLIGTYHLCRHCVDDYEALLSRPTPQEEEGKK